MRLQVSHVKLGSMRHVFPIHMQVLDVQNLHIYSTILANQIPFNNQFLGDLSTSAPPASPTLHRDESEMGGIN